MRHVLHLPYPPSINNYWIASGHRRFISKRGVEFKQAVSEYVALHQLESFGGALVDVNIILRPRNLRLMDIDNCIKPILDALQDANLMDDDKQVGHVSIRRGLPITDGKCIVSIEVLTGDNDERTLTSRS
jgi:crossover junction endodeoxyribonuclease RusA